MRRWQIFALLVGTVLILDQGTKLWVYMTFELHESQPVLTHFFHLTYVQNPGAAFGLFSQLPEMFRRLFFPTVTVLAVSALLIYFTITPRQRLATLSGTCCVIGGAIGNGIDRLWLGKVIDFIDLHWYAYHWPAFNLADSAICIGVGLLLLDAFRQ
jgi:signal peptidase II